MKETDLISRQKAFEYFVTLWNCIGTIMDRDEWEDICMTTANEIPSAQVEIIRCKDCDNYGTRWCMGYESFYGLKDDDYCSHAERKDNG